MKIAVYMICKDEAKFIARAINSALDADEIIVCDTGSTDKTVDLLHALAKSHNPKVKVHEVFISPWRFDDARNTSLSLVSDDVDFCVSLDADEILAPDFIEQLRDFLKLHPGHTRVNHSFQTYWNWSYPTREPIITKHFHERVHSRHGYRWVHPVHEKLVNPEERMTWCTNLVISQHPDATKDRKSYLPLLEQAVKEDPQDWKLWTFLYAERFTAGDLTGAERALDACKDLIDVDKTFLHLKYGELYEHMGNWARARASFDGARMSAPDIRETHMAYAEYLWRRSKLSEAHQAYLDALACKRETQGYLRREDAWDGRLRQQLDKLAAQLVRQQLPT